DTEFQQFFVGTGRIELDFEVDPVARPLPETDDKHLIGTKLKTRSQRGQEVKLAVTVRQRLRAPLNYPQRNHRRLRGEGARKRYQAYRSDQGGQGFPFHRSPP